MKFSKHWRIHPIFIITQFEFNFDFRKNSFIVQNLIYLIQFTSKMILNESKITKLKNLFSNLLKLKKQNILFVGKIMAQKNVWKNRFEFQNAVDLLQNFEFKKLKKRNNDFSFFHQKTMCIHFPFFEILNINNWSSKILEH